MDKVHLSSSSNWDNTLLTSKHVAFAPTLDPDNSDGDESSQPLNQNLLAPGKFEAVLTGKYANVSEGAILLIPTPKNVVSAAIVECEC